MRVSGAKVVAVLPVFFFGGGAFWGLFRGPLKFGGYFGALKTSRGLLGGSSTLSGGRGRLGRF